MFFLLFLFDEGSGSVPLTIGSGPKRPKTYGSDGLYNSIYKKIKLSVTSNAWFVRSRTKIYWHLPPRFSNRTRTM
jgi:hypothetical protein